MVAFTEKNGWNKNTDVIVTHLDMRTDTLNTYYIYV